MKINVPFYKSKKDTDCGPLALKMAAEYLGKKASFDKISKLERQLDSGLVWSAGIARAAKKLGFGVKFISTSNFSHEEGIDYYKKYANDKGKMILEELKKEIKELGVEIIEKDMDLNELLSYVGEKSIPIVLINWYIIVEKDGFSGHFASVTGYDDDYVYVHNPGLAQAQAYLKISREKFTKAWESKGTDKDTVIIYSKTKPL
jgi:hypothetical protein